MERFEQLSRQVNEELKEGEELAREVIGAATTAEGRAEFEHVLAVLEIIEREHADYEQHAMHAMTLLAEGQIEEAIEGAEKVEAEEEQLDRELEALLEEIELFTGKSAKNAEEHEKNAILVMVVLSVFSIVTGVGLALFLVRGSVSRPLAEVVEALDALGKGDTSVTVKVRSQDEIGKVAEAVEMFRQSTIEAKRLDEEQKAEQAAKEERAQRMDQLAKEFDAEVSEVLGSVASAADQMQAAAQAMAATAEETDRQSTAVAAASEQATGNVQTVAAAAEELSTSITEIERQVAESAKAARDAVEEATRTNNTIQGLAVPRRRSARWWISSTTSPARPTCCR